MSKFYGTGTIVTNARTVADVRQRAAAFEAMFDKPAEVWIVGVTLIDVVSGDLIFADNSPIKVTKIGRKYFTVVADGEARIAGLYSRGEGVTSTVQDFRVELSARVG